MRQGLIRGLVAVATGVAAVTALEKQVGDVPAWMAFLAGIAVTIGALGHDQVIDALASRKDRGRRRGRVESGQGRVSGRDRPVSGPGRHSVGGRDA